MGFSLKRAAGGIARGISGGMINPQGGKFFRGPSLSRAAGGITEGITLGAISADALGDQTTPASPEAAELRKIKMDAARAEMEALKGFRERMESTEKDVKAQTEAEVEALEAADKDAQRRIRQKMAQNRSGGPSSIGSMAIKNIGDETAQQKEIVRASFRDRLAQEKERRSAAFREAAQGTLRGTDIGTRFSPVTQPGFLKSLGRGMAVGLAGGFGEGLGERAARGPARSYGPNPMARSGQTGFGTRMRGYAQKGFQQRGRNYLQGAGTRGRRHIQRGFQRTGSY